MTNGEGRIKDDFTSGPISQIPVSWFNRVGAFINGLVGGFGINIMSMGAGATMIEVNTEDLAKSGDNDPSPNTGSDVSVDAAGYNTQTMKPLNPETVTEAISKAGLNTEWKRNTFYTEDTPDGKHKEGEPRGLKLTVCTGVFKIPNSTRYAMLFTDLQFDEQGRLIKAKMAKNCFVYQ